MKSYIYLDHAATTGLHPEAAKAMLVYLTEKYFNPSSMYRQAMGVKNELEEFRERIADSIHADPREIYFTSGGTESNNWALRMAAKSFSEKGKHLIVSAIEHESVLNTCKALEAEGFEITYLPVDAEGLVHPEELRKSIRPDTVLISIMYANNEIGVIQPISELAGLAKEKGILFHTDAVQAYAYLDMDVSSCPIDLLSVSAHKVYGPKGVGFLYIRNGIKLKAFLTGGGQERKRRAGTENVAAVAGFCSALLWLIENKEKQNTHIQMLRDRMSRRLLAEIPGCSINGSMAYRLPGNLNISFEQIPAETILIALDAFGICASAGSACSTGSMEPSHVLTALGKSRQEALSGIRFSIGYENTIEEIDETVDKLKEILQRIQGGRTDEAN